MIVPGVTGEYGITAGHTPIISELKPGLVQIYHNADDAEPEKYADLVATAETPQFTGRVIDGLARDSKLMDKSGGVLIGAELAQEYGITDVNGKSPPSHRAFFGDPTTYGKAVVE